MKLLEKKHIPSEIENKWYDYWLDKKYFSSQESDNHYTIVIPPPNVTGKLHMGHVLNNTIQDILIRKARMEGKNACWIPGTDHASIATESKVTKMVLTSINQKISPKISPTFCMNWVKQHWQRRSFRSARQTKQRSAPKQFPSGFPTQSEKTARVFVLLVSESSLIFLRNICHQRLEISKI